MEVVSICLSVALIGLAIFAFVQRSSYLARVEELEKQIRQNNKAAQAVQDLLKKGRRSANLWKSVTDSGSDIWRKG